MEVPKKLATDEKVEKAVRFIKSIASHNNCFIAYSGGKDSVLLDYLVKEAGCKIQLIHNVTTIDPPYTLSFCERHGAKLLRPKRSFLDLVELKGMPTMFRRFCCKELKEQYVGEKGFFGIRKGESVKRSKCYDTYADIYYYTKKIHTERFFPMLDFTNEDVENVINGKGLECHPLYYDNNGKFCVERRLGCIGCPLQGDRGKMDYLAYPKLLNQVLKRLAIYHEKHGRTKRDAYLNAVYNLFYSNHGHDKFCCTYEGLFDTDPCDILNDYFSLNLSL